MKVGIITYNKNHLKTIQVLKNLIKKKFELKIFLLPFKKRKKRKVFFKHRPDQFKSENPLYFAKKHGIKYSKVNYDYKGLDKFDYFLICGSALLDKKFIKKNIIINCHSGILPYARGLDAFKWSILKKIKLGVSLHVINEKTDSGYLLKSRKTSFEHKDTLKNVAKKHYKNEIDLLSNFEKFVKNKKKKLKNISVPTKRMPFEIEKNLFQYFRDYKKKFNLKS